MSRASPITIHQVRETLFFSTYHSELAQWIDVDLSAEGWRTALILTVSSGHRHVVTRAVVFGGGKKTLRCYAPVLWPEPPDTSATLTMESEGYRCSREITIGSHRPWTVYLMSDLCADDTWAYSDLTKHDRDDYLTTRAELSLGPGNAYNFAAANQADRFLNHATAAEKRTFKKAVQSERLYITPIPDQMLCGIFNLSSYPAILDPYRRIMEKATGDATSGRYAYHMESPTWTNGLVNMLAGCGFEVFGKSLLRYQAPWIARLDDLPRLFRLETAPGRFIYLVLGCHGYDEGSPLLAGVHQANRYLHDEVIPSHASQGDTYPTSAIGLIGMYSDLRPDSPEWGAIKCRTIGDYNNQGWEYPKLVNGTWNTFGDHLLHELGPPQAPRAGGVLTVRGDIGSSWEVWTLAAQREYARFRQAQRAVTSLSALNVIMSATKHRSLIDEAYREIVYLGDHAWNGSSDASKKLNLNTRKRRLAFVEKSIKTLRTELAKDISPSFMAINTLGWDRLCEIPARIGKGRPLADVESGETFDPDEPILIPGFGYRGLEVIPKTNYIKEHRETHPVFLEMTPVLDIEGKEIKGTGGWRDHTGRWTIGPFQIQASLNHSTLRADTVLSIEVSGSPPQKPYDLRWRFILPWKRCSWRGETGGGFTTPGPIEKGGDSLLGIRGSVFSAGECIAAVSGNRHMEFALDQSGMCGLGGKTTATALGTYNEPMGKEQIRATVLRSCNTDGILEWYLLSTGQNPDEALIDQGGARRWQYRCGIRSKVGSPDDADIYRFALGFNTPAEITQSKPKKTISIEGSPSVLPLAMRKRSGETEIDLYNTAESTERILMRGSMIAGKHLSTADTLSNRRTPLRGNGIDVPAKTYMKVVIHE